ncbi:MAG: hypothetical protein DPW11_03950 [bacterium]|nr:hypothetical protein [Candidatus Microgenomates bacterium CPR3]MCQ3944901.1 hypothetical protein [bacterium]RIK52229.1 MAG: hypothetical protein DCC61_00370 [Candidatus Microgenomates bacterium]
MASIYLDTNILIDLFRRDTGKITELTDHKLYISPLSCHILCYATKTNVPSMEIDILLKNIGVVNLSNIILQRALVGPTNDLEDNIQLHSATQGKCQYFLTRDKLLLKLGYFGETAIVDHL